MPIMTREEVQDGVLVSGDAAVESREDFQQVEEHVHAHRIGDDGGQGLHGFAAGLEAGHAAHGHQEQQQADQCQLQPQGMGAEGDDIGGHQKPQAGPWVKDAPLHLRQGLPFQSACGTWPGR